LASSNVKGGAHLDISVNGFWGGRSEKTFLDVKVFNPYALSNRSATPRGIYRRDENIRKHAYEARIREVEHATFTLLIFSATGGMADEACAFYKRHFGSYQECIHQEQNHVSRPAKINSTTPCFTCKLYFTVEVTGAGCLYLAMCMMLWHL